VGSSHPCVKFVVRPFARRIRAAVSLRANTGVTQLARKRLRPGQFARNTRKWNFARRRRGCKQFARNTQIEILRVKKPVWSVVFARKTCVDRLRAMTSGPGLRAAVRVRQVARSRSRRQIARSCCVLRLRATVPDRQIARRIHTRGLRAVVATHALRARCRRVPIARRISA